MQWIGSSNNKKKKKKKKKELKGFADAVDILHSFMTITGTHINNVIKGLKENNMIINHLNSRSITHKSSQRADAFLVLWLE